MIKKIALNIGFYLFVLSIAFFALFPFYYAIITSFTTGSDLFAAQYIPTHFSMNNYKQVFGGNTVFIYNIMNSVLVASTVVLISSLLAITASYAIGRIEFKGKKYILASILVVSMFPAVAVLAGLLELIRMFNLSNSLWSLIFSYMIFTLPFTVWVLTSFMKALPRDLEDAAIMDGASSLTIVFRIFLPIMAPSIVTTGLLTFIASWNEFLFALTFTITSQKRTIPVAIAMLSGASAYEIPWGAIMAASVVVTIPLIVLVLVFQKKIVSGLTAGSVKG